MAGKGGGRGASKMRAPRIPARGLSCNILPNLATPLWATYVRIYPAPQRFLTQRFCKSSTGLFECNSNVGDMMIDEFMCT